MRTPPPADVPKKGTPLATVDDTVHIRAGAPGSYMLDFPVDGTRQRPTIRAANLAAAQTAARQISLAIEGRRLGINTEHPLDIIARLKGKRRPSPEDKPTIIDAFTEAIDNGSQASKTVKDQYWEAIDRFTDWLDINHSDLPSRWSSIDHQILQSYANSINRSLSSSRIRHLFVPIVLTCCYWAAQDPRRFRDLTKAVRLPEGNPKKPIVVLTAAELRTLLAELEKRSAALCPLVTLASTAGLRVTEAARLRLCDIDLESGTLTVTKTPAGRPKNSGSWRTIPLSVTALDCVKRVLEKTQPVDTQSRVFVTAFQLPWTVKRMDYAWQRFRRALQAASDAHPEDSTEPKPFVPPTGYSVRGSRRTFVTMARKGGADRDLLKAYVGQSPGDILGNHYDAVDLADLRTVASAFDAWFGNKLSTTVPTAAENQ